VLKISKVQQLAAWLLPRVCAGCGFSSDDQTLDLCTNCKSNLPWLDDRCYQCGLQMLKLSESIICEKCQTSPPPFNRLCALFTYKPPLPKLIGSLKFGRQLFPGALFGKLLTAAITERWYINKPLPQIIIPVPLHEKRLRKRGYNQATEISLPIAKALGIPLGLDVCTRIRHTKAQARLSKASRTRNLAAAFSVDLGRRCRYKSVALVDDVVTTGSTIRAVSKVLVAAGVESVEVWCVCRA